MSKGLLTRRSNSRPTPGNLANRNALTGAGKRSESRGAALETATRTAMESRFGHDFSGVRVHTDTQSAQSARTLNADAYTRGSDIVFGSGKYAPNTAPGRHLLSHELAHVVQQSAAVLSRDRSVGPARDGAENEAHAAAWAVSSGLPLKGRLSATPGGAIQRSVAGDVGGGLAGAAGGAALGGLLGGPLGAILGGLVGGIAGVAAGDLLSADKRGLTEGERTEAHLVFGDNLDYKSVSIADATIFSRLTRGNAVTPFETIYFPAGRTLKDFSKEKTGMAWLIHEMTHVWQSQHGIGVLEKAFTAAHGASAYEYGGEQGLRDAIQQGKRYRDFNTEQQADITRNYYFAVKGGGDTSLYDPFIAEVKDSAAAPAKGDFPLPEGAPEKRFA